MFDTRRYLTLTPWEGLVTLISDRTYLNLVPANCTLLGLVSEGGVTTRVTLGTHRSTSSANLLPALPREIEYTYERLDPAVFFRTATSALQVTGLRLPTTTDLILKAVTAKTGVVFGVDDFEHFEVDAYGVVTLTARPESLRWVGTLPVTVVSNLVLPLATALTYKSSPSVFLSLGSVGKRPGFLYAAGHDYTEHRATLEAMANSPNGVINQRVCTMLKAVTGDDWVARATAHAFNICSFVLDGVPGYRVLYAGAPTTRYTQRTDKRKLLVLELDPTRCTGVSGSLLLHYD